MRWMTSICSSVRFTESLFWVSQGVYADQNWGPRWGGAERRAVGTQALPLLRHTGLGLPSRPRSPPHSLGGYRSPAKGPGRYTATSEGAPREERVGSVGGLRAEPYLGPHKASLQLGDVGVRAVQAGQVGPRVLKLIVEVLQQLPRQVIVPGGPGGVRTEVSGQLPPRQAAPSLAPLLVAED